MPRGKKGTGKKKQSKQEKELELLGDFVEKAEAMSTDELKSELFSSIQIISFNEKDKKENPELAQAEQTVKDLKAPYDEVIKEHRSRISYVLGVLEGRGVALTRDEAGADVLGDD